LVVWYHAIFNAYGFWLPNDPRGSWSDFVHAYELYRYGGPATTVTGQRSYARDAHNPSFRREAKEHLKYPPVRFDKRCRHSIAAGFARACVDFNFQIHACSIGFDHVHLVTSRDSTRDIEQVVAVLKARATSQMRKDGTHPQMRFRSSDGSAPTPWGKGCWSVFIRDREQLRCAINYVARHPTKEGMALQGWSFVVPFHG